MLGNALSLSYLSQTVSITFLIIIVSFNNCAQLTIGNELSKQSINSCLLCPSGACTLNCIGDIGKLLDFVLESLVCNFGS